MHRESNEKECYKFRMNYLPESFHRKAAKELNETPETRKIELQKLLDLLSDDKSTADITFEEDFLHLFLRHSKYNSLKAFRHLLNFIKFRRNHSNMFRSIPDEKVKAYPITKIASVLPYRCPDGCAIVVGEIGKWETKEIPFEDFKTMAMALFLQPLRCPITQISGYKVIYDFKDTMKHLTFCTPHNLSLFYNASFNCIPGRYKEIHCVNGNAVMGVCWAIIKYAISEKMRKRVFFHSNPEELLNHFPSSIIPKRYGGSLPDYDYSELLRKLVKDHGSCPSGGQPNYY